MALGTFSKFFREVKGQNSYQSEYYVVRQPSHRRRSRARSVERTSSSESRPRKEHHVHEVEIHRKPSRRHGDREKKIRKEYEYRYELFQDDSDTEDNDDFKHVSWAQWPDLHTQLSDYQAHQPAPEPSSQSQPKTDNPDLHQWISAELALLWSSIDQLHHQHKERSANYDPYLQQAILASYATFKQEQIQPLLDEIARLERQGKDYEELVKELFGVIKGYQVELRNVWDREEREKKEKEEKANRAKRERGRRHDEEATPQRREWETWRDFSATTTLAGGSGSNPSSPTGSAPPPYDDGQLPINEIPAPAPAPQTVPIPTVPARPPKELEHPHQPRVRFDEFLHEIPAPRNYTDDEYEYGPRDHRRRERGRTHEHEYTYDRPRSSSKETHIHRERDWQHPNDVRHRHEHRPRGQDHHNDRHHRRHHHDDRSERRFDDRLTDWNIPAPSTHWDMHPRSSPRSARDLDAYEPMTRSEPRTRRRHSVSYSPPLQVAEREGDKYPRGWRVVRFAA
ncbi:hypothetical protein GE21DRAFT_9572 [Neurospora crassa]|uniref:Uncharacterized protein n=1 Tax=Neurospora crassa (strain ATCC 24698 / 74-OR23-1A / CBS 708.71 / DSM 1257 / FGSC 987) TaxID=367110 RepID=Q7RX54_NEUCR|nr:hypothetical protein NCU05034 [Neurospora crassa OR74A]EAA27106.1 hypothetical protein NCU05034 [Neurospora crassa OR74A]KHE83816.1 hypothetical protein GE21DRAFT_9572 [Neurospora crassa]|eukprot:XP_956342.1 hypothetical protein NCU05034 [Neurospora crassa OR74A]